jgi:hypothetical protein
MSIVRDQIEVRLCCKQTGTDSMLARDLFGVDNEVRTPSYTQGETGVFVWSH